MATLINNKNIDLEKCARQSYDGVNVLRVVQWYTKINKGYPAYICCSTPNLIFLVINDAFFDVLGNHNNLEVKQIVCCCSPTILLYYVWLSGLAT